MIEVALRPIAATCAAVAVGLALPVLGAAGNSTGDTDGWGALPAPRLDVQGTIQATVDGRRITWYSVSGESGGKPYSSSSWMNLSSGTRMVGVGGFSTDAPPLESFEWDASGMPASYGAYDGPVFAIAIQLPTDQSSFTVTFPSGGGTTSLSYQPTATLQDVMAATFMVTEGTLSVTNAEISGGLARVEGTFSGTFQTMTRERSVEITNGVFDVEAIPDFETLRR